MYYLLLELGSYHQLRRLRPVLLERLLGRIDGTASEHGGERLHSDDGGLLYAFAESETGDPPSIGRACVEIREVLAEQRSELAGYGLLVDYLQEGNPAEILHELHQNLMRVPDDENAWVAPRAFSALDPFVRTVSTGATRKLVGLRDDDAPRLGDARSFAVDEAAKEQVLDELLPWINGTDPPGVLVLRGGAFSGVRYTAEAAMTELQGARNCWLTIRGGLAATDHLLPLVGSIETVNLHQTAHYLNAVEQLVWLDKRPLLERLHRRVRVGLYDCIEADFLHGYVLYLLAFNRKMTADVRVPLVLIERADLVANDTADLLSRCLERLPGDLSPIILATAEENGDVPAFGTGERKERSLSPLKQQAFLERLDKALTETAKRQVRVRKGYRQTGGRLLTVFHYLHNLQQRTEEHLSESEAEGQVAESARLLKSLPVVEQELVAAAGIWNGLGPVRLFQEALVWLGFDRVQVTEGSKRLVRLGFFEDEDYCMLTHSDFGTIAARALGDRAKALRRGVHRWLVASVRKGTLGLTETVVRTLVDHEDRLDAIFLYHELVHESIDARQLQRAYALLYSRLPFAGVRLAPRESELLEEAVNIGRLRLSLLRGSTDEARRLYHETHSSVPAIQGEGLLQRGRYAYSQGHLADAVKLVKHATIVFQERKDSAGADRASTDFGVYALANDHIADARDYFLMGRSADVRGSYDRLRSSVFRAVTMFLFGNLTRVREAAEQLRRQAHDHGFREYELFGSFLAARALFELGRYGEASSAFQQVLAFSRCYEQARAAATVYRWLARSTAYAGWPAHAIEMLHSGGQRTETLLFLTEAYEQLGRYGDALACAAAALDAPYTAALRTTETPLWYNGFAWLEDTVVRDEPVVFRLLRALRAYLAASTGRPSEAVEELHDLTRRRRVSGSDPHNRIYFYLYSAILSTSDVQALDDRATVLGKSVRFMQERTSRIDDYSDKTSYQHENYWNRRLIESARRYNLFT